MTDDKTVAFLGVPIVAAEPDAVLHDFGSVTHTIPRRVIFCRSWDLWRLAWSRCLRERWAAPDISVLAISRSAVFFIRLASGVKVPRFSTFHTVIRTLSNAEKDGARIFLIDRKVETLHHVEKNLRSTFPGLHFAGRSVLSRNLAESVQVAIKKSGVHFVLAGLGREGSRGWLADHFHEFGPALSINATDAFRRMAGERNIPAVWNVFKLPAYIVLVLITVGARAFSRK